METEKKIPQHVGIILDGNRRWARAQGKPAFYGHKIGAANVEPIIRHAHKIGIKYVTIYAFSTENWKRASDEVELLMRIFQDSIDDLLTRNDNIRVIFLGDKGAFSERMRASMEVVEQKTANNSDFTLNIALNYGGRSELVHAARKIAQEVQAGDLSIDKIDEQIISDHLYTAGQPYPDLIIRTSGEQRLSNFLTWQSAYSELYFTDVCWPAFAPQDLDAAVAEYMHRDRRFGGK